MKKINRFFLFKLVASFFMIFLSISSFHACKSSAQVAIEEQEAMKKNKEKQAEKEYKEAVKLHQAKQSKTTQKMMKKSEKQRKKIVHKTIRKNRSKQNCINS